MNIFVGVRVVDDDDDNDVDDVAAFAINLHIRTFGHQTRGARLAHSTRF